MGCAFRRAGAVAAVCLAATTGLSAQNYATRIADARAQLAVRNIDSAVTLLRSVTSDPKVDSTGRAEAFVWLGVAVFYQGQDSSARADFREALRHDHFLIAAEPLTRVDSLLGDWWEREQTVALCGESLPAWGWPPNPPSQRKSPSHTPMNAAARAAAKGPELRDRPPLEYPDHLRRQYIEGRVLTRAIVDTFGRAELRSILILSATHADFTRGVFQMVDGARFSPAISGDKRVRSCVILPVDFTIRR